MSLITKTAKLAIIEKINAPETINNKAKDKKHKLIFERSFKGYSQANFNIDLAAQPWENLAGINSADGIVEIYKKLVENIFNQIRLFDRGRDHKQVHDLFNWLVMMWSPVLHHYRSVVGKCSR